MFDEIKSSFAIVFLLYNPIFYRTRRRSPSRSLVLVMAVARNLCAGGQARGAPVTPVSRGVWGHAPPENFEI